MISRSQYEKAIAAIQAYVETGDVDTLRGLLYLVPLESNPFVDRLDIPAEWRLELAKIDEVIGSEIFEACAKLDQQSNRDARAALVEQEVAQFLMWNCFRRGTGEIVEITPELRAFLLAKSEWLGDFGSAKSLGEELLYPNEECSSWFVTQQDVQRLGEELGNLGTDAPEGALELLELANLCLRESDLAMTITIG